jgi:DNA polymerase-3 subunit gamma/tau
MSFNNLLNQEKEKPSYYREPEVENKEENKEFTQDDLRMTWLAMCNRMMKIAQMQGIAARMKKLTPTITTYPAVTVMVESRMMYDEMEAIRKRIRVTLANDLHNANVEFSISLDKQERAKPKLSRVELYTKMTQENPALAKLTKNLSLDLA